MSDDYCALEPAVEPPCDAEAAGDELSRAGRLLVDRLLQAGVDLHAGPTLDEAKRLLAETVRHTCQKRQGDNGSCV